MGNFLSGKDGRPSEPRGPPKGAWTTENLDCFNDGTDCLACCCPAWVAAETRAALDGRAENSVFDRSVKSFFLP